MKSYGSCSAAIPDTRHVPIPTTPRELPGSDVVSRVEARHSWTSPIVLRDDDPDVWRNPRIRLRPSGSTVDAGPILRAYAEPGATVTGVAKALGHGPGTVSKVLRDHGVTLRPRVSGGAA